MKTQPELCRSKLFYAALFLVGLLAACSLVSTTSQAPAATSPTREATSAATLASSPTALSPVATPVIPSQPASHLVVFYTSDEHGWMAGQEEGQGAANLVSLWDEEGFSEGAAVLVLSGGDNWTGPAISTWFDGQGMVEVMNAMGYDASAIGNHEFDFGLETLKTRLAEASFPFLSANLRYKLDDSVPVDLGIQPYTILEVGGWKIGVIGLSGSSTPSQTNPKNLEALKFIDYDTALRQYVPETRLAGADFIVVIGHVCPDELVGLAMQTKSLGILMMGGGHCHVEVARKFGDTVILSPGANLAAYAYADFTLDPTTRTVLDAKYEVEPNRDGQADETVAEIVAGWQEKTDAELDVQIGYLAKEIPQRSQAMQDLITETWLLGYPNADIAVTNLGGIREALPAGPITLKDIIAVMPFDNTLVAVKLTGKQLLQALSAGEPSVVGGMHQAGGAWVLDKTGQPLDLNAVCTVLFNDFMYAGGGGFDLLARFDPNAYQTGIDWRQPVIDWITAQRSTDGQPLDAAIAALGD